MTDLSRYHWMKQVDILIYVATYIKSGDANIMPCTINICSAMIQYYSVKLKCVWFARLAI